VRFQNSEACPSEGAGGTTQYILGYPISITEIHNLILDFFDEEFSKVSNKTILRPAEPEAQVRLDIGQGLSRSLTKFSKINYEDLDKYSESIIN